MIFKATDIKYISKEFLIRKVWEVGVPKDNIGYGEPPSYAKIHESHGGGLWQIPDQIADLCLKLKGYDINTFIEIGTWKGFTFTFIYEFLSLFSDVHGISCDINDQRMVFPDEAVFHNGTSDQFSGESFDLAFIDGNHGYDYVSKDFNNVGVNSKLVCFHDIKSPSSSCIGAVKFWNEVKLNYKNTIEFTDCHVGKNLGIGLLINDENF